jgi:ElaB/YqjD/DUF883 family membrane-anchored ribosome-binding protein
LCVVEQHIHFRRQKMSQSNKNTASDLSDDVSLQMAVLREDIANLTAAVASYGKAQGSQLKSAATGKAMQAAQVGSATAAALKEKADVAYSDAEDAIRTNPTAAVGIAVGIGFLIGMIATRR